MRTASPDLRESDDAKPIPIRPANPIRQVIDEGLGLHVPQFSAGLLPRSGGIER